MKLNTPYKTVLFYGACLARRERQKYIAADKDGSLWAHRNKPALGQRCWYSKRLQRFANKCNRYL